MKMRAVCDFGWWDLDLGTYLDTIPLLDSSAAKFFEYLLGLKI